MTAYKTIDQLLATHTRSSISQLMLYRVLRFASEQYGVLETLIACFYLRDPRRGCGERRLGRIAIGWIADEHPSLFARVISLIPQYGRWDDLLYISNKLMQPLIHQFLKSQLDKDLFSVMTGEQVSLCAKWMPSEGKSFARKNPRKFAALLAGLGATPRVYRDRLSLLRKSLELPEQALCTHRVHAINYETLGAGARRRYTMSFLAYDKWRYERWASAAVKKVDATQDDTDDAYEKLRTIFSKLV